MLLGRVFLFFVMALCLVACEFIEQNSGKIISNVNKKLNYLIVGEKPTIKKVNNAKELKIKVITQEEWKKMLNETS